MVTRDSTPSWPDRRPGYLPAAVWEHAKELRATLAGEDLAPVVRLIGPKMARTWEGLARRVEAELSWRLLLDLFRTSAPGAAFDPKLRKGLRRSRELLPQIAGKAWELARLVEEFRALSAEHAISGPAELGDVQAWLEAAGYLDVLPPAEASTVDILPPVEASTVAILSPAEASTVARALRALDPPALLEALAVAAGEHEPAPELPHQAHGTTRKGGLLTEWVRSIDTRYRAYYAPLLRPQGLTLTDTELAAVGSAVLRMEVKRESVKAAREDAPEPLPSDNVIPYRRKD